MILFLKFQPQRVIISRTILTIYRRVERGGEALSLLLQIEIWLANIANFWDYFMGFLKVSDVKENSALLAWHLKQSRHMASDKKKSNASVGCFTWLPIQSNSFLDALVPSISCKWLSLKAAACSEKLFQRFKNICWFRVFSCVRPWGDRKESLLGLSEAYILDYYDLPTPETSISRSRQSTETRTMLTT